MEGSSMGSVGDSAPRPVSRGATLQSVFVGIDSLYLVLEYPYRDVFDFWSEIVIDFDNPRLYEGIVFEDFVLKRGAPGYKLSVWQGDARLHMTGRVEEFLTDTANAGQGMGVMLQLGPKWLRAYGDSSFPRLIHNVLAQFAIFLVKEPEHYPCRLNRLDVTLDVLGLPVSAFSIDDWNHGWVGYARKKHFYTSAQTTKLEGLAIGTSAGTVRFKVYDKVAESIKRNSFGFWMSVWGIDASVALGVARFEWSLKVFGGKFVKVRYLPDLTFDTFMDLFNYASHTWGRLCIPQIDDSNKSRWELTPLWAEVERMIKDWSFNYEGIAKREYDFRPDLNDTYLRSVSGWIGGLMARIGLQDRLENPATLDEAVKLLKSSGHSLSEKAQEKWEIWSKLVGGDDK